ncbi:MAG: CBS domain-containing protein [Limnohabitans sp.]|nr:CBS domain-containing protein [Limnohabitans sp.]
MIPPNSRETDKEDKRSYWQRLLEFLHPGPDSREELLDALSDAEDNQVIGAESRLMLEGVLRMADLTAGHVMVAAPRMDLINLDAPLEESLHQVIDTGHSRFPVYEGTRENLVGILLAKDLLKLQRAPELNIRTLLRPPVFVPESKSLNDLLREFRNTRNHMALVVDEFGRIAGLITIEDVLEQIVGDIEDEFDSQEDVGDIFALADRTYRVSGDASLERVGEAFGTHLEVTAAEENDDTHFDTIGGFIAHAMGHVPRRGEHFEINKLRFEVLHTRGGAVKWFKVYPAPTDKASP